MELRRWKAAGLAQEFKQVNRTFPERRFCFLLGAGASSQSGIPTGARLVDNWLSEIRERESEPSQVPISEWATEDVLGIEGFNFADRAQHYPSIYQRRFHHDRESGYAYLESLMEGKEPSYGYLILSRILSRGRHNAVVTTNFDHLVARALANFTDVTPRSIGHEKLAEFVSPSSERPIIAKVHRDLLLQPKNEPGETIELPKDWKDALGRIFRRYALIVIGYGGNDGSLMGFLEEFGQAEKFQGPIYWTQYKDSTLSPRVQQFLENNKSILISSPGFDELMLLLGEQLDLSDFETELRERHERLVENLADQVKSLRKRLARISPAEADSSAAREVLATIVQADIEQSFESAKKNQDPNRLVSLGRKLLDHERWAEALTVFSELLKVNEKLNQEEGRAITLLNIGRAYQGASKFEDAEASFRKALSLNEELYSLEGQAIVLGNLGLLYEEWGNLEKALENYQEALTIDQKLGRAAGAIFSSSRAGLVLGRMGREEDAIPFFKIAIENARNENKAYPLQLNISHLAKALAEIGELDSAARHYQEALKIAKVRDFSAAEAIILDNLGGVEASRCHFGEAEEAFRLSQKIDEQENDSAVGVAKSRANLSLLFLLAGRQSEAEQEMRIAKDLLRKSAGGNEYLESFNSAWREVKETGKVRPSTFL